MVAIVLHVTKEPLDALLVLVRAFRVEMALFVRVCTEGRQADAFAKEAFLRKARFLFWMAICRPFRLSWARTLFLSFLRSLRRLAVVFLLIFNLRSGISVAWFLSGVTNQRLSELRRLRQTDLGLRHSTSSVGDRPQAVLAAQSMFWKNPVKDVVSP